ncbi:MAG: prenyltransferase [Deltaproteobacteria bacterium]|nr:prenyltransferase [Deltaproteobacteria bacterium]
MTHNLRPTGSQRTDESLRTRWLRACRFHFVPTSVLPAVLGSIIAWSRFGEFHFRNFLLVIAGVSINHLGLNMIDDVFDYVHAVDKIHVNGKNPYTGGSGVLAEGSIPAGHMLAASVFCLLITIVIAIYLTISVGWLVLIFSLIGILSSVFYTVPPVRYGYRGFGELGLLINFGPVICLGAFYVQTKSLAMEPFVISFTLGFMMWSMIIINEIPDYEEDRRGGKLNLVARFGKKTGIVLYIAGLIGAYGTILLSVLLGVAPFLVLLAFLTVPIAYSSCIVLREKYSDVVGIIPANQVMIKVHMITGMLLIIAYLIAGTFL